MANIEPFNVVDFDELDEDAPKGPGIDDPPSGEGSGAPVADSPAVSVKGKGPVDTEESPKPPGFSPITPKEPASAAGDGTPTPQNRPPPASDHLPSPTNKPSATPKARKLPNNAPPSSSSSTPPLRPRKLPGTQGAASLYPVAASKPSVDETTESLRARVADMRERVALRREEMELTHQLEEKELRELQFDLDTRIMAAGYKGPRTNEVRFTANEKASTLLANEKKPQPPAVVPKPRSTIADLPTFQKRTYKPPSSEMKRRVGEDPHDWVERLRRSVEQAGVPDGPDAVNWCALALTESLNKAWGNTKQPGTLPPTHRLWDARVLNYPPVDDLDSFFGWYYTMVVTDALREEAQQVVDNANWAVVCVDGLCTADTASATLEQHMADVRRLQAYTTPRSRMTSEQLNEKYVTMFLKAAGPEARQMLNVVVKPGDKLQIQELRERVSDLQAYATSRFPPLPAGCRWVGVARTDLPQKRPAPEFTEMELADGMKRPAAAPPTEPEARQAARGHHGGGRGNGNSRGGRGR
ncbi:hypothetical protein HDU93_006999, partial [Gonapodya sp. JEL0774]